MTHNSMGAVYLGSCYTIRGLNMDHAEKRLEPKRGISESSGFEDWFISLRQPKRPTARV